MSHNTPDGDTEAYASVIHDHIKEDRQTKVIATLCMLLEQQRQRVVSYKINDNTALCAAVLLKRTDLVEYLISKCGADVNKKGIYRQVEPTTLNLIVPPLWCAAVTGQIDIATILISHGADVNGWSDTQSTPVRVACYEHDLPMVKFLVEKGANIFLANIKGGTCLMNSLGCTNLTTFLISNGANVNDIESWGSTALHYAAMEGDVDSTRLLLQHGSDWTILNNKQWTALMLAAYNGHDLVVQVFVDFGCLHQVQEAYALLGCHFVDKDCEKTRFYWKNSSNFLASIHVHKFLSHQYYDIAKTALSSANGIDLNELLNGEIDLEDKDKLYMKALLNYIGILGENHEDTIHKIRYRGAVYADNKMYQRCIDLWKYAYVLLLDKKDFLDHDTVLAASSLTNKFCEMQIAWQDKDTEVKVWFTYYQ
jgi:ankyrin repeat protein